MRRGTRPGHRETLPILAPERPTSGTHHRARTTPGGPPGRGYPRPVGLVERDAELAALQAHWARARAGSGGLVLVTAESGGGKTALVNEFARSLMGQAPVLWGACDPLATPRRSVRCSTSATSSGRGGADAARGRRPGARDLPGRLRGPPRPAVRPGGRRPALGGPGHRRPAAVPAAPHRHDASALVVGTLRPDEIDPSHPLRALLGDAARSPGRGRARPAAAEHRSRPHAGRRPAPRRRPPALAHRRQPVLRDPDARPRRRGPARRRSATPSWPGRWTSSDAARDLLDLLVCAPEAIPDRLLPQLGIGVAPLRSLTRPG